ncbi:MAG TPA: aromatic ring-hydroxylating dioxygenase subunit alpha [Amaricoccus sp.]|uniref:aromatic ring-hydroxylating oxygenase subunit alpha n=1 Tax=Amaricoccus sp. TaxID=1872485 RepID=UPI002BBF464A|nr:aromatic ring-hydroxylating dioxygenase subunit alpha [Amaricoccus sp.]HMQ95131.1 aromatic ring-hydroxylating dioxygenase subunit alpha [Amaricoccus sp.]HMR51850.1 aromatic ring-hydroxylating dioxygenase subunit alpha [Amaricoccus sp.]HMR62252.1 aromatic ring-hydroxylating dioxygenase subunit alpha [Amaricoccus sp.]HMU01395.1 aromatic ring-hydroxylating dioxygenase subunit alpha [Amaricoccus sp.]
MIADTTALNLLASRVPDHALPRPIYTDPAMLGVDLAEVWYRDWLFAIPACEIPKAGNFVTMQIGAYPIVIVRGADGAIRAFHNACRHRGSRVRTALRGPAPKLACPHHQWTYELDGRLLYARDMGAGFRPAEHGLKPVACEAAGGMVFVCLADEPASFDALRETAGRDLAPHRLDDARIAFESTIVEKGNWKLVMENNRECCHCAGAHPSPCRTFPDRSGYTSMDEQGNVEPVIAAHWAKCEAAGMPPRFHLHPSHQWRFVRVPLLGPGESFTMDGRAAVPTRRLSTAPFADAGSLPFFHYPNSWNHFLGDHATVFRMLPISATETEVTTKWLVRKDAVEGTDYDLKNLTRVRIATNGEDRAVVEENQRGVTAPAFVPGPCSRIQEDGVIQFVDWYCRRLGDRLGGGAALAAA